MEKQHEHEEHNHEEQDEHAGHHHHDVSGKNLFITIILNVIITVSQIVGGIFSGSLALLSDALHNFSDVLALVIAWWAKKIAQKQNTDERTFGYKRAEIVAALFNASVLVGIGIYLIVESIGKFFDPQVVDSGIVIALAILSIILNAASVLLIKDDAHDNLNMKAAYLHLLSDVMTSVAVLFGGIAMYWFDLFWLDPLISIAIAIYLIKVAYSIVKESTAILMQFGPENMTVQMVQERVEKIAQVANIHHVHLWRLDDTTIHLEAHVDFKEDFVLSVASEILESITKDLQENLGISHVTLQAEFAKCDNKDLVYTGECKHV